MKDAGEKAKTSLIRLPQMPLILIYSNIVPIGKIFDNPFIFSILYRIFDDKNPKIFSDDPFDFPAKQETVPFSLE